MVIAIIGALVSLLLPSVQAARESAHRASCTNNLKQIALAVQEYNDSQGCFPPSGIHVKGPLEFDPRDGKMFSWLVLILPHLEQTPLYNQFDFNRTVLQQPTDPQAAQLPTLLCPSESSAATFFADPVVTQGKRLGKGNYAAYVSPYHVELQEYWPGASLEPASESGSHWRRTVEYDPGFGGPDARQRRDHAGRGRSPGPPPACSPSTCTARVVQGGLPVQPASLGVTQPPNTEGPNLDIVLLVPGQRDGDSGGLPCAVYNVPASNRYMSAAPRSRHPGGVNAVFLDGHTAFVPNRVRRNHDGLPCLH